jgi:Tol biopolymer transport system component
VRIVLFLFFLPLLCFGQGIIVDYGQNSSQVLSNELSLKKDNIEIIYYQGHDNTAKTVFNIVESVLTEYENRLNYNLSNGIKIIVYNNIFAFQKSNINITNPQHYAGGYTLLNDNISSVYFDGNLHDLNLQTRRAVAEVIVSEFIFGGNIRERVQSAALLNLPDWYYKGLVYYLAESWNVNNDNILKDFFQNKKQNQFTSLQKEEEWLAGHSIWRFLEEKYGGSAVSNVVFLTRISRSIENSFGYYTGLSITQLLKEWERFYIDKYSNDELIFKLPKGEENSPKKLSKQTHTQLKISPNGEQIAIVTNTKGKFRVYLYDIKTKNTLKIKSGGHQLLNRDMVNNYPLISWNSANQQLGVILYENNQSILLTYNQTGKLLSKKILKESNLVKDFSYNNSGNKLVLSVLKDGHSNLVLYHLDKQEFESVSKNEFDHLHPRFSTDDETIYFISNQLQLKSETSPYLALFSINLKTKEKKYVYGLQNKDVNLVEPIPINERYISLLSDKNGIVNNYIYDLEKKELLQQTNYKRSIQYNDISVLNSVYVDLLYFNNRYRLYIGSLPNDFRSEQILTNEKTKYRVLVEQYLANYQFHEDSLEHVRHINDSIKKTPTDTIIIPVKKPIFLSGHTEKDETIGLNDKNKTPKTLMESKFSNHLGVNFFIQQFDNSILNNYLFPSNLQENVFNYPLVSPVIITQLSDPLKNHLIEAGVRVPLSIKATDLFFQYTNRSKRWDKKISAFRRSRTFDDFDNIKMVNSQAKLATIYPFNERSRLEFNVGYRNDRVINLGTNKEQLNKQDVDNIYGIHGIEYVFDNVTSNGLNLFQGVRFKCYTENYHRVQNYKFISNNGFDFRYYQKLHRQIYVAARFNGAFSFGTQTTAYYMGGVENWIIPARSTDNFNYNIPQLNGDAFAFQTIAAPVRGFNRNARGGNKFMLLNAELRVPFFSYLIQKPITSDFFKSLMLVGFMDIGTAWQGSSPYSASNPFNTRIVQSTQYVVTVNSQRDPFLYAFGIGARAKILGHYIKVDHGWGFLENKFLPALTTLSMGLDF